MSAYWLVAAFLGFIAAFAVLMFISFRERKLENVRSQNHRSEIEIAASDKRLALMVLCAVVFGALLALFVGYVIFLSGLK